MNLLSEVIEQFEADFLVKYKTTLLPGHKAALFFMKRCRKEHGPHMLARCDCGAVKYIPHSCGHRNCPHCQNHESDRWIQNQMSKLLPTEYYLLTFTLPGTLRDLAWKNQKLVYSLMFQSVQNVLKTFTKNDKMLQGMAGFTAILHTHSRKLNYHPHIHVVMAGGAIDQEKQLWRSKSGKYLFRQKSLAKVFRAMFLKAVVDHGLQVLKKSSKNWVVNCKHVGKGDKAIIYLGRYLYRGVIRERDIICCDDSHVTFRYFHAEKKCYCIRSVKGEYFLWLYLQHVLPKGFRRIRSYGFLHPCSKKLIRLLQQLLKINVMTIYREVKRAAIKCISCGADMKIVAVMIPAAWVRSASGVHGM